MQVYFCFSCHVLRGTGIAYSGWWCRSATTATTFTLIGVVNKLLTILVNVLIWDNHASPMGIISLAICLAGASLYTPSKMRKVKASEPTDDISRRKLLEMSSTNAV